MEETGDGKKTVQKDQEDGPGFPFAVYKQLFIPQHWSCEFRACKIDKGPLLGNPQENL